VEFLLNVPCVGTDVWTNQASYKSHTTQLITGRGAQVIWRHESYSLLPKYDLEMILFSRAYDDEVKVALSLCLIIIIIIIIYFNSKRSSYKVTVVLK
jgi:hypothetical protein